MNKMTSREQQIYQMLAVGGYGSRGENGALTDWNKRIFITIGHDPSLIDSPGKPANVMVSFPFEEVVKKPEVFKISFDKNGSLTEKGISTLADVVAYCDMAKRSFQNNGRLYTREDALKLLDELTYENQLRGNFEHDMQFENNMWEKSGRGFPDLIIEKNINGRDIILAHWNSTGIYELTDKQSGRVVEFYDSNPSGELAYDIYKSSSYENSRRVGEFIGNGYSGYKPGDITKPMQYEMLHSNMSMFRMANELFNNPYIDAHRLFDNEVDIQIDKLDEIYGINLVKNVVEPEHSNFEHNKYRTMYYDLEAGKYNVSDEVKKEFQTTLESYEDHRKKAYDEFDFKKELADERITLRNLNNQIVAAENETKIRAAVRLEDEKEISWQEIKSELTEKTFIRDHAHNDEHVSEAEEDYISNDELVPEAEEDCASFEFG